MGQGWGSPWSGVNGWGWSEWWGSAIAVHWAGDVNPSYWAHLFIHAGEHRPKSKDMGFIPVGFEVHLVGKGGAGRMPAEFLTLCLCPLTLQHHSFAFLLSFSSCLLLPP